MASSKNNKGLLLFKQSAIVLRFWLIIFLLALFIEVFAQAPPRAQLNNIEKHVLVLHSYHEGYLWTDDLSEGIYSVLSETDLPVDIQIEYMDTKRIYDDIYIQKIIDLYKYKFRNINYDAIISTDDNAFNFLRDHRDELFPGTPVIFCGTNYITNERAAELPNSIGINEAASIKQNIELILNLHPSLSQLAIIIDSTTTGMIVKQYVDKVIPDFEDKVDFKIFQNFTISELITEVEQLPPSAVILYTVFLRDKSGRFIEYDDSIEMIIHASSVPIYLTWDFSMSDGVVGGLLTSGKAQGVAAANLALEILNGKPVGSNSFVEKSPNKYIFDFNALQNYKININKLPSSSIIYNLPEKYSHKYKKLILRSIVIGVILSFIILVLIINIIRRKKAEIMLSLANEKLEERVRLRTLDLEQINNKLNKEMSERINIQEALYNSERLLKTTSNIAKVGGWEYNVEKNQLTWTEEVYKIKEIDSSFIPDLEKAFNFYYPISQSLIQEAVQRTIEHGESFDLELQYITAKGNRRWIRAKGEASQKNGKTAKLFGTIQDITERKKAEELLKKQEERLRVLNSIIHHDISNDLAVINSAVSIFKENHNYKMLNEIINRVNKSSNTIAEYKLHKEFIDSNADLIEINLFKMLNRVAEEFPIVKLNMNKKCGVYADETLYYVFTNLVSNSLKHGKSSQVIIDVLNEKSDCIIKVIDNGTGIPNDFKHRIFEEGFYAGKTGHTGMGLHLCKKNIEHYGGTICQKDNQPSGALFEIRLRKAFLR